MSGVVIRDFEPSDGKDVQIRLRIAWRMEIPKQFNLTQVIAQQPLGHAIVAVCVAIFYAFTGEIGTLCLAIPGFYIALYMVVLVVFLFRADELLLKELADIPANYKSAESGHFWVVESEGLGQMEIVGTMGLMRKNKDVAQIRHMAVMKKQGRDLDITRRLLNTGLQYARTQRFTEVELLTSAVDFDLARLLDQVGFKLIETFYIPNKHFYILPMQVLHVRLDEAKFDGISCEETKTD